MNGEPAFMNTSTFSTWLPASSAIAVRRRGVLLVALVGAVLVAMVLWTKVTPEAGRPILDPDEFVSYGELPDFVGEPLGAGSGVGSSYSYMLQTLRDGDGFVLVETIYADEELPNVAPRPPEPGSGALTSMIVDGGGNVSGHSGIERPPVLLSVSDGCRQIVVSGTGFEPSNARIEWLEEVITERLADPGTVGHDFCQGTRLGALDGPA